MAKAKTTGKDVIVRERMEADAVLPPEAATPYAPDVVTAQYKRAVAGALEMVRFGAMLVEIDTSLTRETRNGCIQDGDTLKGWIEAHCPDVNYKTAMRFKALAEGVQRSCNVPAKVPLSLAMPGPDGEYAAPDGECPIPHGKLKKLQQEVWALVEGKSARQLQFAFAADEAAPKGGDRRSDKKLTEEDKHEQMVKAANAVWNNSVDALVDNVKRLKSHLLLTGDTVGKLLVKVGIVVDALNEAASTKE